MLINIERTAFLEVNSLQKYKKLFFSTFKLSACTFGGGFVIIPLMRKKFVETEYVLTMHNSQNYSLMDTNDLEVLCIMHKGIAGGWMVESNCGFAPEIICGIFTFCRYIEQENEFLIV